MSCALPTPPVLLVGLPSFAPPVLPLPAVLAEVPDLPGLPAPPVLLVGLPSLSLPIPVLPAVLASLFCPLD